MSDNLPLRIAVIPVTPFQQNASIVVCTATNNAAIVDPGGDVPVLLDAVKRLGVTPQKILLTHGHIDHAGGAKDLAAALNIPIEGPHEADLPILKDIPNRGAQFGMSDATTPSPDRWLNEGDIVNVGDLSFDVLHVPGHAPGHVVFVHGPSKLAIVGDTLFQGSIGRTDFPYGDHDLLISGIREKLLPLGDDMAILPGHGNPSTIGAERMSNPFIQG